MKIQAMLPLSPSVKFLKYILYAFLAAPIFLYGSFDLNLIVDSWLKILVMVLYFFGVFSLIANYEYIFSNKICVEFKNGSVYLLGMKSGMIALKPSEVIIYISKKEKKALIFLQKTNEKFIFCKTFFLQDIGVGDFSYITKKINEINADFDYAHILIEEKMYL